MQYIIFTSAWMSQPGQGTWNSCTWTYQGLEGLDLHHLHHRSAQIPLSEGHFPTACHLRPRGRGELTGKFTWWILNGGNGRQWIRPLLHGKTSCSIGLFSLQVSKLKAFIENAADFLFPVHLICPNFFFPGLLLQRFCPSPCMIAHFPGQISNYIIAILFKEQYEVIHQIALTGCRSCSSHPSSEDTLLCTNHLP